MTERQDQGEARSDIMKKRRVSESDSRSSIFSSSANYSDVCAYAEDYERILEALQYTSSGKTSVCHLFVCLKNILSLELSSCVWPPDHDDLRLSLITLEILLTLLGLLLYCCCHWQEYIICIRSHRWVSLDVDNFPSSCSILHRVYIHTYKCVYTYIYIYMSMFHRFFLRCVGDVYRDRLRECHLDVFLICSECVLRSWPEYWFVPLSWNCDCPFSSDLCFDHHDRASIGIV